MDQRAVIIVAGALVGMVAWQLYRNATAVTAGDENSDILSDTYDDMQNMITGWPSGSAPYQEAITAAAQASGVPVSILAWLLWKESRYNPAIIDGTKRSSVGAVGIAQFMPATAASLGVDPLDPSDAIPGAARYLATLYRSTGTWAQALAAYNWGIGNVQRKGLAAAPAETQDYYTTILAKAGFAETV
ncbi:lytic transglycosylase domain-containing protein [Massilia sp. TW-1]|uniref:Lytic transglycosylase domain-containing protein n=1 Tax=Telluria antibiotica TaxID=2717319 RepID=A0ABX0PFX3_9BURK|nr:lytic transglycosylase domain-containing protein [Telluria antibiotica]NIA56179.1 lytic transglycosylase domain-containing protein [Telluria antibiotica]